MEKTKILSSIKTEDKEVHVPSFGFMDNLDELKPPGTKCGEIFMYMKNNLVFICSLCNSTFHKIENFLEHLKRHQDLLTFSDSKDDPLDFNDNDELKPVVIDIFPSTTKLCIPKVKVLEECDSTKTAIEKQLSKASNSKKSSMEMNSVLQVGSVNALDKSTLNIQPKISKRKGRVRKNKNLDLFCEGCNKWFPSKIRIQRHKLSCGSTLEFPQTVEMPKVAQMINNEGDKITPSINVGTVFAEPLADERECRYCHRRFYDKYIRKQHEDIHTGERKFSCELCGKCFRLKTSLNKHLNVHKNIKPFKCHLCDVTFPTKQSRKVHLQRHLGEKPFKCQYCDMCFVVNNERRTHERQHTGEKPYKCNQCGQCFVTASRLRSHAITHRGDKKFKCEVCDKSFYTAYRLKYHALSHTNERLICNICGSKFLRKKSLKKHNMAHHSQSF